MKTYTAIFLGLALAVIAGCCTPEPEKTTESDKPIKVGSFVYVKGCDQRMVVESIKGDDASCVWEEPHNAWQGTGPMHKETYKLDVLKAAKEQK